MNKKVISIIWFVMVLLIVGIWMLINNALEQEEFKSTIMQTSQEVLIQTAQPNLYVIETH